VSANVTYLLGAGASCSTLPTIESLTDEIGHLGQILKNQNDTPPSNFKNYSLVEKLGDDLLWLWNAAQNHLTIDTLAKKMYLQDELLQLERLKCTLSIFFMYKQFTNRPDKRYDGLLASLLIKNGPFVKLPENVKILTWNYDCQIELSAMDYLEQSFQATLVNINSFPRNQFTGNPSIIHLNGISGYVKGDHSIQILTPPSLNSAAQILDEILSFIDESNRGPYNFKGLISFAWEQNPISQKAIEFAGEIMSKTDVLIVIGYSVPFFNRQIDRMIFYDRFINTGGSPKKIYFQNPYLDGTFLTSQFKIDKKFIEHIEDCKQFYIPYEL